MTVLSQVAIGCLFMKFFGTDGIRGPANEFPITPEIALRVGRAMARLLPSNSGERKKFLLGRDTRVSGPMLESSLAAGLMSEGAEVILVGVLPTPAVAFLTQKLGCDGGVMLTASHNPFQDNGIKIFAGDGYKLTDEVEAKVEDYLRKEAKLETEKVAGSSVGSVSVLEEGLDQYLDSLCLALPDLSLEGVRIVFDGANGAGSEAGVKLFEALGAEVTSLGVAPDGININENIGAMHPEAAAAKVLEVGASIGVCLDGDGDRLVLIDSDGEVVDGDRLLCLAALALHEQGLLKGDTLVATVMSNLGLDQTLAKRGIAVERAAVGDRHVLEKMREKEYNLGGENSGHVIFSDFGTTGDGLAATLQILATIQKTGKSLQELASVMPIFPQRLVNIRVKEKPPISEVKGLPEMIAAAEAAMGDEGRVLIRYSGTEKKMRVMVEAQQEEVMEEWCSRLVEVVREELGEKELV